MKRLDEALLFSNGALDVFKKMYNALEEHPDSTLDDIELEVLDDDEIELFSGAYQQLKSKCVANSDSIDDRLLLRYACDGPSTIHNTKLYYITRITSSIWQHKDKIEYVDKLVSEDKCSYISTFTNKFNAWLTIPSLYEKEEREFSYVIQIFNILTNKKKFDYYFPDAKMYEGQYYLPLDLTEDDEAIFPNWAIFEKKHKQKITKPYCYYAVTYKLFLEDPSETDVKSVKLIPSGIGKSTGRNIYHYVQLWAEPVSKEDIQEWKSENTKEDDPFSAVDSTIDLDDETESEVQRVKNLIRNSKMNDQVRSQVLDLIDKLT